MSAVAREKAAEPSVLSLAHLLEQQPPTAPPCLVEPGLLPPQGILFVGGEPKVGKSLLVATLGRPARIAPAFPSLPRAVCWSASSNCPSRSSSAAWPPCGVSWGATPIKTYSWIRAPP